MGIYRSQKGKSFSPSKRKSPPSKTSKSTLPKGWSFDDKIFSDVEEFSSNDKGCKLDIQNPTAKEIFELMLDPELIDHIVTRTNNRKPLQDKSRLHTSTEEVSNFILTMLVLGMKR